MADLAKTPASVLASATALTATGISGATVAAGDNLYIDTTAGNVLKLADSNAASPANVVAGVALNGAAAGQPLKYVYDDPDFTPGAALTVGQIYAQSSTPGGTAPVADLVSGDFPTVLFVAKSTTKAVLKIVRGGVAKP